MVISMDTEQQYRIALEKIKKLLFEFKDVLKVKDNKRSFSVKGIGEVQKVYTKDTLITDALDFLWRLEYFDKNRKEGETFTSVLAKRFNESIQFQSIKEL